jgi:hypothetical protein
MLLLDYRPFLINSLGTTTTIKKYNLSTDEEEIYFNELLHGSVSGTWELDNSWSTKLQAIIMLRSVDPVYHFEDDKTGTFLIKKKNEVFTLSTNSGPSLGFVDSDIEGSVLQECLYDDTGIVGDPPTQHVNATVHEALTHSHVVGAIANFSKTLVHYTTRTLFYIPGVEYISDLLEEWNLNKADGYVTFINFPFPIDSRMFYEMNRSGHSINTTGSIHFHAGEAPVVTRGNAPNFVEEITQLVTPYETVLLTKGDHFSYGWLHLQDNVRGVLVQGLQVEQSHELAPILYSGGIRKESSLALKLGCWEEDILGIIYYPLS